MNDETELAATPATSSMTAAIGKLIVGIIPENIYFSKNITATEYDVLLSSVQGFSFTKIDVFTKIKVQLLLFQSSAT